MRRMSCFLPILGALSTVISLEAYGSAGDFDSLNSPMVIAHRGASALRPEHTLAAYQKAIDDGAEIIEPDLVISKDGVLVARHENALAILNPDGSIQQATTNVADLPQFASRRTTKTVDGTAITGWFSEDFTLTELKMLRARERLPAIRPGNVVFNDQFEVPTLEEIIALAKEQSEATGRVIGIFPETKFPTYFRSIGLPLEEPLLAALERSGWNHHNAPVIISSFEVSNLMRIHALSSVRLALAVSSANQVAPTGLREIATYAYAVLPHKELIIPFVRDASGVATGFGTTTSLVKDAHAVGLAVYPWTMSPENCCLPVNLKVAPINVPSVRGNSVAEIQAYLNAGIDGFFTDDSAVGRAAVEATKSSFNYQGLWWNPAESGWGISFAHQSGIIFATWFTYDASGKPWWLIAELRSNGAGVYSGPLSTVGGPLFNSSPFGPTPVETGVGTMTATFTNARHATIAYSVNGISQSKAIERQAFGEIPTCIWGTQPHLALATNYTDLWWNASESGWGINFTHQGDTIFATWFTYDATGKPWWLIAQLDKSTAGVYAGLVSTVSGPSFDSVPWSKSSVVETPVGTATATFANGNAANFAYNLNGTSGNKTISRQVFVPPGTVCQ